MVRSDSPQPDQEDPPQSSTLMALREPLNSMLCEETKVQTGLSCARIVFTFCRFWISQTCKGAEERP